MVAALQFGTGISTNFLKFLSAIYPLALLFKWMGLLAFGMVGLMWYMQKKI
ncbi:hypothetical protein [Flavobacterium sp. WC2430]|uniref:hypothetical protein n=1 Tax=Flavobacterium sp. WC2430 TaxID=3234137 RepID=UPI0034672552